MNILRILPYIVVFLFALNHPGDTDLGWHLKYGEHFFRTGSIVRENIFSAEMPDFRWVNSSWATDLITYQTYNNFGFLGLSVLGAIVITATFFLIARAFRFTLWQETITFPVLLFLMDPVLTVSFRGQLLTFLFLSLLYMLLNRYGEGKRRILLIIPILFILWSNIHGQFILGLFLLGLWLLVQTILNRGSNILEKIAVMAASAGATLVNPFGLAIYQESLKHFGNPVQKYILEWLPFDQFSNLWWYLIIWVAIICITIYIYRSKLGKHLPLIVCWAVLTIPSFWMKRYAWPMYLTGIPLFAYLVEQFAPKNIKIQKFLPLTILGLLYVSVALIKLPNAQITRMNWDTYCRVSIQCTKESAQYLRSNPPNGKYLTFYNWGGWLIWNYPQIKPSIDGRMHLWRDDKTGYSAFEKYFFLEQNITDINQSDYSYVYIATFKPLYTRLKELVAQDSWELLYEDKNAAVFRRTRILGPVINE